MRSILLILLFLSPSAFSYPIYFKCSAQGSLEDVTMEEVPQAVGYFSKRSNSEALKKELCSEFGECQSQFFQLLTLATDSAKIVESYQQKMEINLKKVNSLKDGTLKAEIAFLKKSIFQCRETMESMNPSQFIQDKDLLVFYPYHTPYAKITASLNDKDYGGPPKAQIYREGIRRALAMGADPYMALAIGVMEEGRNGIQQLYLDPIGRFKAMGCEENREKNHLEPCSGNELHSYGNCHTITPMVRNDPKFSSHLKEFAKSEGNNPSEGNSYWCRKVNQSSAQFMDTPDPHSCCVKLYFKVDSNMDLEKALVYEHLRQIQDHQAPNKKDPAFRIQYFNGYSSLMGGAEPVAAFRAGVNFNETPTYGYQGMDYMLNSLMSNPWLQKVVKEESDKIGRKPSSILCMDRPKPGLYEIDSDEYFNKHKNAPRMESILESVFGKDWKKSYPKLAWDKLRWEKLTERQRNVLRTEINFVEKNKQLPTSLYEDVNKKLGMAFKTNQELLQTLFQNVNSDASSTVLQTYFKSVWPSRNTLGEASQQTGYTWKAMSKNRLERLKDSFQTGEK